jgi:type VI secretion system Hcp family effector
MEGSGKGAKRVSRARAVLGVVVALTLVASVAGAAFGGRDDRSAESSAASPTIRLRIPGLGEGGEEASASLAAYRWSVEQTFDGRTVVSPFVITKAVDKSSPKLYEMMVSGGTIPEVYVEVSTSSHGRPDRTDGGAAADFKEYVVYALREVTVLGIEPGFDLLASIDPGFDLFTHIEEVSLAFREISIDYTALDGPVETLACGTGADWAGCTRK